MGLILGAWAETDACTAQVVSHLLVIDTEEDELLTFAALKSAVVASMAQIINENDDCTNCEERDEHGEYP